MMPQSITPLRHHNRHQGSRRGHHRNRKSSLNNLTHLRFNPTVNRFKCIRIILRARSKLMHGITLKGIRNPTPHSRTRICPLSISNSSHLQRRTMWHLIKEIKKYNRLSKRRLRNLNLRKLIGNFTKSTKSTLWGQVMRRPSTLRSTYHSARKLLTT